MSHLLSEAFRSLNARGWFPIGLKTGGIKRYQPTSASAAVWPCIMDCFYRHSVVRVNRLVWNAEAGDRRSRVDLLGHYWRVNPTLVSSGLAFVKSSVGPFFFAA